MSAQQTSVREGQWVAFRLQSEVYGVEIGRVQGIERLHHVTKVPRTPRFVDGVINLRGQITPVIDLRTRLGFDRAQPTKETRIVVVTQAGQNVGLVVDRVEGVVRISNDQVESPSELIGAIESQYVDGIAKLDDQLLILLKLDEILDWRDEILVEGKSGDRAGGKRSEVTHDATV